ncbi:bacillithiol biosynthesis cysteine-adding enzyme BshC [Pontimicrobium aquaticum]|uniref:Putative cysteine ligase BshC n=1 Tax=Pontimicrobium aquaticum TaxID=2565367 RepID=A0A4V5LQQ9_9FLAO|nr:bacillithiol biosynthesis cysteine-adding enzyme BshC [Pontimicrobium aquaticum]TJY36319.1 bacillithiol biosynthesis cysteine-adding enzyme BshC [Pontimicrobium aquaticum]
MPTDCISFNDTNYFSSLVCDYLEECQELQPFYNRFPKLENFKNQIEEKEVSYNQTSRNMLVLVLKEQYKTVNSSRQTLDNIALLEDSKTFTITTGHQLNLFTGPLYFLYKIISTINLTKALKEEYPDYNFVPIYWMASEDHDFEEINYFNFKGKKIRWNRDAGGGVGDLDTKDLDKVFETYSKELGQGTNANFLKQLFKNAYLNYKNLAEATRYIANELFKDFGLVVIDANNRNLKRLFIPYIKEELCKQTSHRAVSQTNKQINELSGNYKIQVNPREINLFYLKDGLRERIVYENGVYRVFDTDISWSEEDVLRHLDEMPERFSPNVIMRPLYQEVILPNLCYIGGGGELAYWFQLKAYFNTVNVPFPMLLLRNSVLIKTKKQSEKLEKLGVSLKELFAKQQDLINSQVKKLSTIDIDFSLQKEHLQKQFKALYELAEKTDKSFLGAVAAQEKKQVKGLSNLEKRLLKAQKRKLNDQVSRITEIQNQLFPGQSLQERNLNFSELYLEFGDQLIQQLILNLQPLKGEFLILEL